MNNHLRLDSISVEARKGDLVDSAGLAVLIKFMGKIGFFKLCDNRLPVSVSNSAYPASTFIKALFALCVLYPDSSAPLDRIDDIRASRGMRRILGVKKIPSAKSVGDWLRRMAKREVIGMSAKKEPQYGGYANGLTRMQGLHYELAGKVLADMKGDLPKMVDFDACAIIGSKKCDAKMYTGERGTMSYLAFIENVCLMAELESGNHSPSDNIDKRVVSCFELCREQGIELQQFRSDSAAYVGEVMNECSRRSITFYIRADNDEAVRRAYGTVGEWRKPKTDKAVADAPEAYEAYELGTAVHCMATTNEAFTLVAKRELVEKNSSEKSGQCELDGLENTDYKYFSVATNEAVDEDSQDAAGLKAIVTTYNKRGNMENRIKQLVSDAQAGRLPTSDLDANRIYFYVMTCLHNLMELFKYKCLDPECQKQRLPTLVRVLFRVPAVVALHARCLYLRLPIYKKQIARTYQEVLKKISALKTMFSKNERQLAFAQIVFRRD